MSGGTGPLYARCRDYLPVPESETCCGLFGALSLIRMVPDCEPFEFGVNVTIIVQVPPFAARDWPLAQLVPGAKAKLPLMEMLLMMSGVVPVFESVTDLGALVVCAV